MQKTHARVRVGSAVAVHCCKQLWDSDVILGEEKPEEALMGI